MLAILYLVVAWILGYALVQRVFGSLLIDALVENLQRTSRPFPLWLATLPTAFICGILLLTWLTYLIAFVNAQHAQPLSIANALALPLAALCAIGLRVGKRGLGDPPPMPGPQRRARPGTIRDILFVATVMAVASAMMFYTFRIEGQTLIVGISVFSDFGPHLAVIRSFSEGHNFPTQYPHFPDGTARYHFLFQFLAGNLEYLGLPLDWAFNLPSILAFTACAMLLYTLAVAIVGRPGAGLLTVLLFFFRSSPAWLDMIKAAPSWPDAWTRIIHNSEFVGRTLHEDWGLWNQNVYLNQRHLPLGLAMLFFTLLVALPLMRRMRIALTDTDSLPWHMDWWREFVFTADAWLPETSTTALQFLALGIFIGLLGFWNGATVIGSLLLLLFLALFCKHRFSFLLVAMPAVLLAYMENQLFIGAGRIAVQPQWVLGFLSPPPATLSTIARYYLDLLGLMPWILIASFVHLSFQKLAPPVLTVGLYGHPRGNLWLVFVFATPIVMATTVQFTPDIAINHKYVMIGVMLLNIIVADFLLRLWDTRQGIVRAISLACLLGLTATGIIDLITIYNRDTKMTAMQLALNDPLLEWLRKNTGTKDILLTDWYSLHTMLLAGRKIYYGWPYYAWSAGYNTAEREKTVSAIYGGSNPESVRQLVRNARIDHIMIDDGNRRSTLYKLNEPLLRQLYPVEFESGGVVILKTH